MLDTRHKRKSFTVTTIILAILVVLMFYVGLSYLDPPPEEGISVNFGYMDTGSGDVQPTEPIRSRPEPIPEPEPVEEQVEETAPAPEPAPSEPEAEKVVTQESEESIVMKKAEEERQRKLEAEKQARERAEQLERDRIAEEQRKERERLAEQERVRQEQEAKKRKLDAMMGGLNNSDGTATGGEGNDNTPGDKGQPNGDPYAASYFGTPGSGSGGIGYGLGGRKMISRNPVTQECNEYGRVVVEIHVDRNGNVLSAVPGVKGSTNTAKCLLDPAAQTARSYKFNPDPKAPARQIGFVVVNFKLGE